ncbi:hypothetical protein PtA15_1A673 [Puccinia triticina]|uniref:Uncharacterized protein n=1 Tax=Puccinia triticina TaxID=208348 RepID=A0ABY7C8V2_9BASI|nr:uncharacterized protein PtA15_1A673 [Puccinia triticina]WAQ81333.1 hypothetical protein PtA15_1A673 [Puccinia triticina]
MLATQATHRHEERIQHLEAVVQFLLLKADPVQVPVAPAASPNVDRFRYLTGRGLEPISPRDNSRLKLPSGRIVAAPTNPSSSTTGHHPDAYPPALGGPASTLHAGLLSVLALATPPCKRPAPPDQPVLFASPQAVERRCSMDKPLGTNLPRLGLAQLDYHNALAILPTDLRLSTQLSHLAAAKLRPLLKPFGPHVQPSLTSTATPHSPQPNSSSSQKLQAHSCLHIQTTPGHSRDIPSASCPTRPEAPRRRQSQRALISSPAPLPPLHPLANPAPIEKGQPSLPAPREPLNEVPGSSPPEILPASGFTPRHAQAQPPCPSSLTMSSRPALASPPHLPSCSPHNLHHSPLQMASLSFCYGQTSSFTFFLTPHANGGDCLFVDATRPFAGSQRGKGGGAEASSLGAFQAALLAAQTPPQHQHCSSKNNFSSPACAFNTLATGLGRITQGKIGISPKRSSISAPPLNP